MYPQADRTKKYQAANLHSMIRNSNNLEAGLSHILHSFAHYMLQQTGKRSVEDMAGFHHCSCQHEIRSSDFLKTIVYRKKLQEGMEHAGEATRV